MASRNEDGLGDRLLDCGPIKKNPACLAVVSLPDNRTFPDLAEKLGMDVADLMRQCNAKAPPSKALVKGMARELKIDEGFLEKLAEEVRKDLGRSETETTRP